MENDPSKKESKGKRILKKALRRNSKSSNSSQNSSDQSGVSRSKSFENAPLPTLDPNIDDKRKAQELKLLANKEVPIYEANATKNVDFQEGKNEVFGLTTEQPAVKTSPGLHDKSDSFAIPGSSKNGLKRKLEEESGAGTSGASTGASDTDADDKDPSKDKKKKNRCAVCRKKVGLTGFECRCGGLFCGVHRYSDKHECSFDYRELGAQEIRRNNPVVVSQKIHKI